MIVLKDIYKSWNSKSLKNPIVPRHSYNLGNIQHTNLFDPDTKIQGHLPMLKLKYYDTSCPLKDNMDSINHKKVWTWITYKA
jgi:hypothetical protein